MPIKETLPEETISAIKDSIIRSDCLLKGGVPVTLDETTVVSTNCYAYSIGIMYNFMTKIRGFYNPGFTERDKYMPDDTPEDLMEKVHHDLENLGIKFREINLGEKAKLRKNEYLVKVYMADPNEKIPNGDFHFIRKDKDSGMWFHKLGWQRQPDIVKPDPGYEEGCCAPGVAPDTFTSICDDGFSFVYYSVGYIAIEEPLKGAKGYVWD